MASLDALVAQQAPNGQIPKYVDPQGQDADFWYLGCIDATLWWLIAVDHVRRAGRVAPDRWQAGVDQLQLLEEFEAVDVGQADVEDRQVVRLFLRRPQRRLSGQAVARL